MSRSVTVKPRIRHGVIATSDHATAEIEFASDPVMAAGGIASDRQLSHKAHETKGRICSSQERRPGRHPSARPGGFELPCANCKRPVRLQPARFLQLIRSDALPLCGICHRYESYLILGEDNDDEATAG